MPKFITRSLLTAVALTVISPAFAHGPELAGSHETTEPTIATQKLNDTLSMLYGEGGFTGGNAIVSAGPDGVLVVDNMLATMSDKFFVALDQFGGADDVKYILNTHWHFDHAGGNEALGRLGTIIAHTNVRERLSTAQSLDVFQMTFDPQPKAALPVVTYNDSVSVHFNGEEIRLIHMPQSHTDTDSIVYFTQSNVLHVGDLFFNGIFPFIDIQNGGDVVNMTKNVEKLLYLFPADVVLVPGHGPVGTLSDLRTFHRMLEETTAHVRNLMRDGQSLDEIKTAGVPDEWAGWAWQLDAATWNGIIYSSLTK